MAKRKIIWSHRAQIKLYDILKFFADRNKSKIYSDKLYKRFNEELKLLLRNPEIGVLTDMVSVRGLIIDDYILYYEITDKLIIIHTLWDCKQNPDDLVIK